MVSNIILLEFKKKKKTISKHFYLHLNTVLQGQAQTGPVHVFTKQRMTSAEVINQVALTDALNEMKHEWCEKAIECHHPCHESSLGCTFIKSEFIMLIFYLTGLLPF